TVTLTIGGAPATVGTVDFYDAGTDGTRNCTNKLPTTVLAVGLTPDSNGRATVSTSALAPGSHIVLACYTGTHGNTGTQDANASLTQTVNKANTTTTVTSDHNPSTPGQLVTFTATVSAVAPGSGTPTGTVTFKDGAATLGTGMLSGGTATFATSSLSTGS